jgi:hypothetical protein
MPPAGLPGPPCGCAARPRPAPCPFRNQSALLPQHGNETCKVTAGCPRNGGAWFRGVGALLICGRRLTMDGFSRWHVRRAFKVVAGSLISAALAAGPAAAQATRAEAIGQQKAAKAPGAANEHARVQDKSNTLLRGLERVFAPKSSGPTIAFNGFRPDAGLGAAVGYGQPVGHAGLWTTKAGWSVNDFKLAETDLSAKGLKRDRLDVSARARLDDAPALSFFGLGVDTSKADRAVYALRAAEGRASADLKIARRLRVGGAVGYLEVRGADGKGSDPPVTRRFAAESLEGLDARLSWLQTGVSASLDYREAPGYTQSGGLYEVRLDHYADSDGRFGFSRTRIDLRQFIPIFHANWIVALQGRADLTHTAGNSEIPFFMLPYIGGGSTLRGFAEYRFADRNTLLLRGELRWTPVSVVDMAVFLDQGTVADRWRGLSLGRLRRGVGYGVRFHGAGVTIARFEVAHSGEGWYFHVAQDVSF